MKMGEGALKVLRWLKGLKMYFLEKSWFYNEPEETGNVFIGTYHFLGILIFKEHDLVYHVICVPFPAKETESWKVRQ